MGKTFTNLLHRRDRRAELPSDLPEVREEISHYYNSVRRLDDTFGRVIEALDASGLAGDTLVLFITDNGSAFPFAKANTYLASTHTPLLVRWPGVTEPGSSDATHFVGNVDFFPTFMDAAGLPKPAGLDGRSFVPLLRGEPQDGREFMFTQIDYTIGGPAKPMRCIQDGEYGYIFNAFADGSFEYKNNNEGLTFKAMQKQGPSDPALQARVDMFRHRVPEEFYHLKEDPGCTQNLIASPEHQERIGNYQKRLREWMVETKRPQPARLRCPQRSGSARSCDARIPKLPPQQGTAKRTQVAARGARVPHRDEEMTPQTTCDTENLLVCRCDDLV